MQVIDIIVLVIMLFCIIRGYQKGFLYKFIEIISFIASIGLAWYLSEPMSKIFNFSWFFQFDLGNEMLNGAVTMLFTHIICFIILFVLFLILFFVLKMVSKSFVKIPVLSGTNKLLGALLGAFQAFLILSVICLGLSLKVENQQLIENSSLRYVQMLGKPIFSFMEKDIERFAVTMESISIEEGLNKEQIDIIYQWLIELNVEEGTAENIIHSLR